MLRPLLPSQIPLLSRLLLFLLRFIKTVSQLQKASVPVLVDLKERAAWHYKQVSSVSFGPDISYNGEALIDVQNQIVALSEFVILQGDNPKHDLEEYSSFVSNKITAFTNDILNG